MLTVDEALTDCILFDMGLAIAWSMSQSHGNLAKPSLCGEAQRRPTFLLCMLKVCASWVFLNNWLACARTVDPSFLLPVFTAWDHSPIDTSYQDWLTPPPVPYLTNLMRFQAVAAVHGTASEWSWPTWSQIYCMCVVFLSFLQSLTAPSKVYRIQLHWKQHTSQ